MAEKYQVEYRVYSLKDINQVDREHIADVGGGTLVELCITQMSQYYLEKSHKIVEAILEEISVELSEREDAVYWMIRREYADRGMI